MKPRPIRVGIVGCGKVAAEHHLPALRRVPGVRVVAAVDVEAARLKSVADRFGIEQRLDDYRTLLERDDIDLVAILTPTPSHAELGLAVLDAEKHLFLEKPTTLTLAEGERLIERAARSSRQSMVGYNLRRHRLARRMREIVASGALGQIHAVRSAYTHWRANDEAPEWHRTRALGGGVVLNEAVHHFDLWRFLLGREVEQISSNTRPSPEYEDQACVVAAQMSGGVLASGVFSLKTSPHCEVEIFGEAGRLYLSFHRFDGLAFYSNRTYAGNLAHRLQGLVRSLQDAPEIIRQLRRGGDIEDTYRAQWQHFIDCVREGRPPECSLADGNRATRIALAAVEAGVRQHPVTIG